VLEPLKYLATKDVKEFELNPVVTRAAEILDSKTGLKALMPPFAVSFFCNFRQVR